MTTSVAIGIGWMTLLIFKEGMLNPKKVHPKEALQDFWVTLKMRESTIYPPNFMSFLMIKLNVVHQFSIHVHFLFHIRGA